MLFNSYIFVFCFLPISLLTFHFLRSKASAKTALISLIVFSLGFYAYWSVYHLLVLCVLLCADYLLASLMQRWQETHKPIVHHSEVTGQFKRLSAPNEQMITLGLSFFIIGLAKKVVLADFSAVYASAYFNAVATGTAISAIEAWAGMLCYSAQLYWGDLFSSPR